MTAGPAKAVHTVPAPETTARATQPVCAVPTPMRIGLLSVSRGGVPNLSRSIAHGPDHPPGPSRTNLAEAIDRSGPLRRYRLETLHP